MDPYIKKIFSILKELSLIKMRNCALRGSLLNLDLHISFYHISLNQYCITTTVKLSLQSHPTRKYLYYIDIRLHTDIAEKISY